MGELGQMEFQMQLERGEGLYLKMAVKSYCETGDEMIRRNGHFS